jgi:1-acyl-sn-glycerol-3-phosphate acyltransferase
METVMKPGYHAVNRLIRIVFSMVCRVDTSQLGRIPRQGPAILIANHVNFLEAPVMMAWLDNPAFTGIAKRESWKSPLLKFLFDLWEIIPIDRGLVDREAFNRSVEALKQGKVLAMSPEGTRSKNGMLLKAKPGVSILAARSDAAIVPVAFWDHEHFWTNLKRLRRTRLRIAVGQAFRLTAEGASPSRDVREAVADEMMFKVAELLPEQYRGVYAFENKPEYRYLTPVE